jgi:S1-C subfamily serine protease
MAAARLPRLRGLHPLQCSFNLAGIPLGQVVFLQRGCPGAIALALNGPSCHGRMRCFPAAHAHGVRGPSGGAETKEERGPFPVSGAAISARAMGQGTGIIIRPNGLIITNHHVIEGAQSITVTWADGRSFAASVVGRDRSADLAGGPTVTVGVVSAVGRSVEEPNGVVLEDVVQTDAAINPGNPGRPLLNLVGEIVGIHTVVSVQAEGIGFAMSAQVAERVVGSGSSPRARRRCGHERPAGSSARAKAVAGKNQAREGGPYAEGSLLAGDRGSPWGASGARRGVYRGSRRNLH